MKQKQTFCLIVIRLSHVVGGHGGAAGAVVVVAAAAVVATCGERRHCIEPGGGCEQPGHAVAV